MARGDDDEPHPVDRYVGRKVCEKRIALGYNQTDLGRALGLTFQQIQKYEKGANRISSSKLWDIATFFQVDIGYFFEGLGKAASTATSDIDPGHPPTRSTLEIASLAPRLSVRQQKMVLDLIRTLTGQETLPGD